MKIKIGIIINSIGWNGGINYFKNLIFCNKFTNNNIEFVVISSNERLKKIFKGTKVYITPLLKRFSFFWFLRKIFNRILFYKYDLMLTNFLKKKKISIITHNNTIHDLGRSKFIKNITWIPDFQHLQLKQYYSKKNINYLNKLFKNLISNSDGVIVSSKHAMRQLKKNFKFKSKKFILNNISALKFNYNSNKNKKKKLIKKYKLKKNWFLIPNQFWQHKNHALILKTLSYLNTNNIKNIFIVCCGNTDDYRNKQYFMNILNQIKKNKLENNIKIIGDIPYQDVSELMRYSIAVINPSKYEGWSTSVEEAISMGKKILLSKIKVHIEQQNKSEAKNKFYFFTLNDYKTLANYLKNLDKKFKKSTEENIKILKIKNKERIKIFIKNYNEILRKVNTA